MARKQFSPEKWVLFSDANECAQAAAPVFAEQRWRWTALHGFPKEHNILDTLLQLKEFAEEHEIDHAESGRLVFWQGQFGHERPKQGGPRQWSTSIN